MGIRYDRDSRRPTNGPVIYFTGIDGDGSVSHAINNAIISELSFYAWRMPGEFTATFGSSESFCEGLGEPGYIISYFNSDIPFITIPFQRVSPNSKENKTSSIPFPSSSTSYKEYEKEVLKVKEGIKDAKWQKVVTSRVLILDERINLGETFGKLCLKYPDAYIFCFHTPATGTWIGASPELLLRSRNKELLTVSLAGTKPIEQINEPWDEKNISEQNIVTNYIVDTLTVGGISCQISSVKTIQAGPVCHLSTSIKGNLKEELTNSALEILLKNLSPTPALCGYPKKEAYSFIQQNENFSRGCYGGFSGPFFKADDFNFFVTLRCARIEYDRTALFAGGGINEMSKPNDEWEETENKLKTLLGSLDYT